MNRMRFTLKQIEGHSDMILFIENGFAWPIVYQASYSMTAVGEAVSMAVCPAQAGMISVEHWPQSFNYLRISKIRLAEDGETSDPGCH